jgi:CHASE1-domain containing sensor protein
MQSARRGNGAAYLVLVISLVPVLAVFWRSREGARLREEQRFQEATQHVQVAIADRLRHYLDALQGTRGLFQANGSVTREQWQRYIEGLNLRGHFLGIQGISYAQRVPREHRAAHERAMRTQGMPEYRVRSYGSSPTST